MRRAFLTGLLLAVTALLTGCGVGPGVGAGIAIGTNIISLATIHKTIPDALVSLVTGRDCSLVNVDRGKAYCRPPLPPPPPPEYCTRTLADVMCWSDPHVIPNQAPALVELPFPLAKAVDEARRAKKSG